MGKNCNTITSILLRKGTDQLLRNKVALDPDSVELMDFDLEDWMKFAYNFAKHVNYFGEENSKSPDGDWRSFFKDDREIEALLEDLDQSNELTPHLTLFVCFIRLLDYSKQRFNNITKRHLDFFYGEILKLDKLPAQSDNAFVVFELAKSFDLEKLEKGLRLNGGKDANGDLRKYELTQELAANKASIAQIKNFYYHKSGSFGDRLDKDHYVRVSQVANSYDGKGDAFPGEDVSWLPFGTYEEEPAREKANIGFSIGADILKLSEGERHIQFTVNFEKSFSADEIPSYDELNDSIEVYYTMANKWEGPIEFSENNQTEDDITLPDYKTIVQDKLVKLYVKLGTKNEPTGNYDPEVHLGGLTTKSPVFRFVVNANTESGIKVIKALSKAIKDVRIEVDVRGVRQVILDSDAGKLNPTKPMFPFTTNPIVGSSVVIDHQEIFEKNWTNVQVGIGWLSTPEDFQKHYEVYQTEFLTSISPQVFAKSQEEVYTNKGATNEKRFENLPGPNLIVTEDAHFKAAKTVKLNNQWIKSVEGEDEGKTPLFSSIPAASDEDDETVKFRCQFSVDNPSDTTKNDEAGPIKLTLDSSFFHDIYPQLYAMALTRNDDYQLIPNKPYTPLSDEIIISYTAEDEISLNNSTEDTFENRSITLFHEHPFGHSVEHDFLRKKYQAQEDTCSLVPRISVGGELYIGLENAVNLQTVSLFVQLLEGSENPLVDSFSETDGVTWEVLCSDFWRKFDTTEIKLNEIDNFLKSGLVRLEIPKEATKDNMRLDKDLIWLRAKMSKSYDAVSRVLTISTQGARAVFVDNDNDVSHLDKGLPAETISKLEDRVAYVKSVTQPYNSFGGKPIEDDASYYKRVSERIRHKNRAINLWDYENIILQEFPDVYRAKCLNHTNTKSFLAAGCVTVVVVPDTVNKNMFNILQPRVSKATLNEIKEHVSKLTSLHVNLDVINPIYEEVEITIKVKFHDEFDKTLYSLELNEDLKEFLAPWAFDEVKNVEFGVTLHRSVLIDFVEKLHYIDYIESIDMKVGQIGVLGESVKDATPSSPKSILVSAEKHFIETVAEKTETATTIEEEC
ncbi:MAG: baseplate J/gp47 family protein [Crocinitomicaceae bacterium]